MFQVEHDKFDIKRHLRGVYLSCIMRRFNGENKTKQNKTKKQKKKRKTAKQSYKADAVAGVANAFERTSVTSFNQSKCCYHGHRQ